MCAADQVEDISQRDLLLHTFFLSIINKMSPHKVVKLKLNFGKKTGNHFNGKQLDLCSSIFE